MMTFLLISTVVIVVGMAGFYVWYLTWPVVVGRVHEVHEGVSDISKIRSPRKYRLLTYEFEYDGTRSFTRRQGLIVTSALSPNKKKSDPVRISVCTTNRFWSCPYRPFYELFSVISFMIIIAGPILILAFLY
jgi:hypothetical protein